MADLTVYAVYIADTAYASTPENTIRIVTATNVGSTICFEALRNVTDDSELVEQGILFVTKDMLGLQAGATDAEAMEAADAALVVQGTNRFIYTSSGQEKNDVTGLTLKNANGYTVYAKGYLIVRKNNEEHIILTDTAVAMGSN